VNASSTGKNFHHLVFSNHYSSLALIPYLLVVEETLVRQTVGSFSPQHDSNPASLRTHQASLQPVIQEPFLEPEKLPSPTREARNDVSMNTHPSIFIQ
jgi:hypothetical protein